ncbi:MAG: hypothetical protein ACK5MI_04220 [Mangrovibacterium sp.]
MATKVQKQLRTRIKQLKTDQAKQRDDLSVMLKEVSADFQSGNFIRKAVHGLLLDKQLHKDLFSTITPIITSYISGVVMHKTKYTKVRVLAALSQLGINGIASTYGETIQKYIKVYAKVSKNLFSKNKS